jgi:hypothetical protein
MPRERTQRDPSRGELSCVTASLESASKEAVVLRHRVGLPATPLAFGITPRNLRNETSCASIDHHRRYGFTQESVAERPCAPVWKGNQERSNARSQCSRMS